MLLTKISFSTLSILFALIFIGGYVSSSGVGLSCPDWPLCPAGLVPMKEFIIEYFHRTVAATTGIMVFVTMFFTLRSRETSRFYKNSINYCISIGSRTNYSGRICHS